jgi:type III restriction enzyme
MSRIINEISARLSLRAPQRDSLEIMARVATILNLAKDIDVAGALKVVQSEYPSVTDFERDFPSLCFALATGVGKTRLMGAFIAWLYLEGKSRNFFVLAPNLTIYNKLIADFSPGTAKYVFNGISEFVTAPPVIITGDNYESGKGVRDEARRGQLNLLPGMPESAIHINIFNISKIDSEAKAAVRENELPRIKRLQEYIGQSYFEYLSGLPDLVLLMDEAHRYRAKSGMRAISELKPILGLELTATPFTETPKGPSWFKNAVYSYSLAQAITDGFVKKPAVATRQDFEPKGLSEAELERIKLEDGVRLHETVRSELRLYAKGQDRRLVKPFMLVIARDTDHARDLLNRFKSPDFFGGQYADKVIEVHSALSGEEKEETVKSLLAVEDPEEKTEVVIHVNMLKEGWDVTNLYTIVPLRAANARTLIEQSIGRGLRLPYGKRTGVTTVDRLTIVAHDKFQEIVDEANKPGSLIRRIDTLILGPQGPAEAPTVVVVDPLAEVLVAAASHPTPPQDDLPMSTAPKVEASAVLAHPQGAMIASVVFNAIQRTAGLGSAKDLLGETQQAKLTAAVKAALPEIQEALPGVTAAVSVAEVIKQVAEAYVKLSIDVPRITVVPQSEQVAFAFTDFDLDVSGDRFRFQPVNEEILVQQLHDHAQDRIGSAAAQNREPRLEDYVVRELVDYDDVDYDSNAELLYKLAGQLVDHLRSRPLDDGAIRNVLLYHQKRIGALIHAQLDAHCKVQVIGYETKVLAGHTPLRSVSWSMAAGEEPRPFRVPVDKKGEIRSMLFAGFRKCLYPLQKFDADPERQFAVCLENEKRVEKWVKPAPNAFQIMLPGGQQYLPDFVVEADDGLYLCEVKRADYLKDPEVLDKARAAITWCESATAYTKKNGGKPWRYLMIPHTQIQENLSLDWFVKNCRR